jgi:hypothetical protein
MKRLGILIALAILWFGIGCGDDDDDGSAGSAGSADSGAAGSGGMDAGTSGTGGEGGAAGESGSGGSEPMDASQDGGPPAPTLSDLEGTWQGPCYLENGEYKRVTLVFSGNTLTTQLELYGANDFTCQNLVLTVATEMDVSLAGPSASEAGAYQLDLVVREVTATMNVAEAVTYANTQGIGGYTDWELGVAKDVAGMDLSQTDMDAGTSGEALPEEGDSSLLNFVLNDARNQLRISAFGGGPVSGVVYAKQ